MALRICTSCFKSLFKQENMSDLNLVDKTSFSRSFVFNSQILNQSLKGFRLGYINAVFTLYFLNKTFFKGSNLVIQSGMTILSGG